MKRRILLFILLGILPAAASGDGFNAIARTNTLLKKAEKAMKEKEFRVAALSYEDALKENPDLPAQTRLNLGHAYFESGQSRLAQKNYLNALNGLSQAGQKSAACLQIGNLFAREKDYKSALEWYRKSLLHQPDNKTARRNYETAWRLNKKKEEEEEKKQQPERNPQKQDQQNQQQKEQNQNSSKPEQNKTGQEQRGKGNNSKQQDNPESEGKERNRDKEESNKNQSGKRGEDKQEEEEERDEKGKESRKKTSESDSQDPEAYRMDKRKLQESGLNEEQAKNMLKAMRQSEVKYLQQRQFKGKTSTKTGSGPRW